MPNLYLLLELPSDASPEAIKAAYRRLAKALHPDLHPGNPGVAERFKDIGRAYGLLRDPTLRTRYDRGEIDEHGRPRRSDRTDKPATHGQAAPAAPSHRSRPAAPGTPFTPGAPRNGRDRAADGVFERLFGKRGRRRPEPERSGPARADAGRDARKDAARSARKGPAQEAAAVPPARCTLHLGFRDAALGGPQNLTLASGKIIRLTVPAGARNGQVLRLRRADALPREILVTLRVAPHAYFTRASDDVHIEMPLTLREAAFGTKLRVPTLDGSVDVAIPPGTANGTRLRLRGRGIAAAGGRGDQYVTVKVIRSDGDAGLADHAGLAGARTSAAARGNSGAYADARAA